MLFLFVLYLTIIQEVVAAQPANLDEYDPKEQAEKEREALVATVTAMRAEASKLTVDVGELQRRYETAKIDLAQLAYEDDVDSDRQAGLKKMAEVKAKTEQLAQLLEDTEQNHSTLAHMLKRSQDEKLAELATLKAFEDSIRVHRVEQELAEGVLRQVQKSRDEELVEFHKMQVEVRKHLANLDRKLEARRLEVRTRQEKAKWRIAKLQEEMQLKAQAEGDLTEEEERAMIEKAKNLSQEASELRAEKIRVQGEADAAEAEYHRVRFAAGVSGPGPETTVTEEGAPFVPPEPEPIIQRFAKLEDEVNQIEEQLADYSQRMAVLQQQQANLRLLNQPRAKDAQDEQDHDVALTLRLTERTESSKRALETAARELDVSRNLKLQLEQSVSVLLERLDMLMPIAVEGGQEGEQTLPEISENESIASAFLSQEEASLPSPWCVALHKKAIHAVQRVQNLMRTIDVVAATNALYTATAYLQNTNAGKGQLEDSGKSSTTDQSSRFAVPSGTSSDLSSSSSSALTMTNAPASSDEDLNASDRRLEATIESLIVKNEWSIRVRPGSTGNTRQVKTISGKVLNEAVQAFEKTWKDVGTGALNPGTISGGTRDVTLGLSATASALGAEDGSDPFSKSASQQRRRNSREMNLVLAGNETGAKEESVPKVDEKGAKAAKKAKEQVDANKPKGRDVQKFLATAASIAGDDVEDSLLSAKKDTEEVPSRDKLKKLVAAPAPKATTGR
jgi:hypothetical protein